VVIFVESALGTDGTLHAADATVAAASTFDFGAQTTAAAHAHALFTFALLPGGTTLSPGSIVHTRGIGTPQVNVALAPASIVHARAMGTPTVTGAGTLTPQSIVHTRGIGTPTVSSTAQAPANVGGPRRRRPGRQRVG